MKQAVADTSALVSLAFSGKLTTLCQQYRIHIPLSVKDELRELIEYGDKPGEMAKLVLELIKQEKIMVHTQLSHDKAEQYTRSNVDWGEASCLQLAIQEKISLLFSDDLDATYELFMIAKAKNISIKISAAAIITLLRQNKITKIDTHKSLKNMIQHRKWEKSALEYEIEKYMNG